MPFRQQPTYTALFVAMAGMVGWLYVKLGTVALSLIAHHAQREEFAGIVYVPLMFAAFFIAVYAIRFAAIGIRSVMR